MPARKREAREAAIAEDKIRSAQITNAERLPVENPKPKVEPKAIAPEPTPAPVSEVTKVEVFTPAKPEEKPEPKVEEKVVRRGPKKTA